MVAMIDAKCKSRLAKSRLTKCELRIANCELQVANCKLLDCQLVVKSGNVDCLNTAYWLLLTNVSTTRRRTTKQNVDPRCTYIRTNAGKKYDLCPTWSNFRVQRHFCHFVPSKIVLKRYYLCVILSVIIWRKKATGQKLAKNIHCGCNSRQCENTNLCTGSIFHGRIYLPRLPLQPFIIFNYIPDLGGDAF
jgi:hypothetical protein